MKYSESPAPTKRPCSPLVGDRCAGVVGEHAEELAGRRIERVDFAVALIGNEEVIAELAEVRRSDRHAPGGIEQALP